MTNSELVNSPVGDLLRRIRSSRGLTQEELAELVEGGISVDTISNIERGRVRPRRHTLLALCEALNADPAEQEQVLAAWRSQAGAQEPRDAPSRTTSLRP